MKITSFFSHSCKLTLILTLFNGILFSQTNHYKLGFTRALIPEVIQNNLSLSYPWAGGINSVFFSQIDLNLDGVTDFIAFEKHGNKISPFINVGTNTNPQFVYAPEYKYCFPDLHDWVILKDFNNDGAADIFTCGLGGIRVFQNVSNNKLAFKLVADPLNSNYYGNEVNIFSSPDDYLGLADLNGDGKIEILNFGVMGKFVHYQKNISTHNSYLTFSLADECWGKFSEGADNNAISLLSYCREKWNGNGAKHVGSSIYILDFNDDGLPDIVIGDVDYPGLKLLINGGTMEEALMVYQTELFPNAQNPVHLYSMPAVSPMNLRGAEKPDLFISPSDPSLTKSVDLNSVWHYAYHTQSNSYILQTKAFLQEDMIDVGSGAVPILFDWSGDGLLDLFVANYGSFDSASYQQGVLKSSYSSSISYYKNVGSSSKPKFEWITSDFGNLKKYGFLGLYPTFSDLNGDGRIDLLCGNSNGDLLFFENCGTAETLPQFKPPVTSYQDIKVEAFSTPQLFDVNRDGKLDLVVGSRKGTLSYYQNVNTNQNPIYQHITSNFGNVDTSNPNISYFGYSTPHLFIFEGETLLLSGSEQGELLLFTNIDNNLEGDFTCLSTILENFQDKPYRINEGIRVAAAVADLDGDGKPDLIVGNWAGGVAYFSGCEPLEINIAESENCSYLKIFPNPTTGLLRIDMQQTQLPKRGLRSESLSYSIEKIELFDIYGKKICFASYLTPNNVYQIDISNMSAGVYILKIVAKTGTVALKVIKM